MTRWWLIMVVLAIWTIGCASPRALEQGTTAGEAAADTAEAAATNTGEAATEEAAKSALAAPVESNIEVDPKTKQVSGKASIAFLKNPTDAAATAKSKQAVEALVKAINDNTEIECSLLGAVSIEDLATLQVPLLVVTPDPALKEGAPLQALVAYVQNGGVVLVDGSWTGNILPGGTRITPRFTHPLLTEPYNLGESRQRRFRPIDAIEIGERLGVVITNQNYGTFWAGRAGSERTHAIRQAINTLVYALKTSTWSKKEEAPAQKPRPGGVLPTDIAPI